MEKTYDSLLEKHRQLKQNYEELREEVEARSRRMPSRDATAMPAQPRVLTPERKRFLEDVLAQELEKHKKQYEDRHRAVRAEMARQLTLNFRELQRMKDTLQAPINEAKEAEGGKKVRQAKRQEKR